MNNKFVFIKQKAKQIYNKFYVDKLFFDKLKYLFLGIWFFVNIVFYAVYVNLASTAGYFLSQVQREQNEVKFSYNITKFNMTEYRKGLWDSFGQGGRVKKIQIDRDVVYLGGKKRELERIREN